jgi:hypothetical protein
VTVEQVLAWADAHYQRTGRWPSATSGAVRDVAGETWAAINQALGQGRRGLPGDASLARLLGRFRGASPARSPAPWTAEEDELVWTLPPAEVARRTGHTLGAVYHRRHLLGVSPAWRWTPEEDELVRTLPAKEVARRTGHTLGAVYDRRQALGISPSRRVRD